MKSYPGNFLFLLMFHIISIGFSPTLSAQYQDNGELILLQRTVLQKSVLADNPYVNTSPTLEFDGGVLFRTPYKLSDRNHFVTVGIGFQASEVRFRSGINFGPFAGDDFSHYKSKVSFISIPIGLLSQLELNCSKIGIFYGINLFVNPFLINGTTFRSSYEFEGNTWDQIVNSQVELFTTKNADVAIFYSNEHFFNNRVLIGIRAQVPFLSTNIQSGNIELTETIDGKDQKTELTWEDNGKNLSLNLAYSFSFKKYIKPPSSMNFY